VIIEGEFELILCYGGAKPTNFHLDSIIHAVNEEIIEWLEQRERIRPQSSLAVAISIDADLIAPRSLKPYNWSSCGMPSLLNTSRSFGSQKEFCRCGKRQVEHRESGICLGFVWSSLSRPRHPSLLMPIKARLSPNVGALPAIWWTVTRQMQQTGHHRSHPLRDCPTSTKTSSRFSCCSRTRTCQGFR
jgi:hypothetical protein